VRSIRAHYRDFIATFHNFGRGEKCPWCDGTVLIRDTDDGGAVTVHLEPMCRSWILAMQSGDFKAYTMAALERGEIKQYQEQEMSVLEVLILIALLGLAICGFIYCY
jgi:hypothetical protein